MNQNRPAPAQLWTGTHDNLTAEVITYIQRRFCTDDGCGVCTTCQQVREQQHHAVIWVCPEKQYTLELLKVIFERVSFALHDDQEVFFILQKADFLSTQCANSLLKSIEEPPQGYHFILCAERTEYVLPTIKSRCLIYSFAKDTFSGQLQQLYTTFTTHMQDPLMFLRYLQKHPISETQTIDLVDQLIAYWMQKYKEAHEQNKDTNHIVYRIDVLKKALVNPPMPGSSKLFWKQLYMQFHINT